MKIVFVLEVREQLEVRAARGGAHLPNIVLQGVDVVLQGVDIGIGDIVLQSAKHCRAFAPSHAPSHAPFDAARAPLLPSTQPY